MADAEEVKAGGLPNPPQYPTITLILTPEGLKFSAPRDKGLCYMILELARDEIKNFFDQQARPAIIAPPPGSRLRPFPNGGPHHG